MRLRNIPGAETAIYQCDHVVAKPERYKNKWKELFGNNHPIHIEIGMGKGQFITELALRNPDINYIGIERYPSVLIRAVEKYEALEEAPENLYFLCVDAAYLDDDFEKGEIDRIYLNFSDPWPKARHAKRRLTSKEFFKVYDMILVEDGQVEFKTDNRGLFDFSVEQLAENEVFHMTACTYDLHHDESMNEGNIMTEYEEKFSGMGNPIHKLIARRR